MPSGSCALLVSERGVIFELYKILQESVRCESEGEGMSYSSKVQLEKRERELKRMSVSAGETVYGSVFSTLYKREGKVREILGLSSERPVCGRREAATLLLNDGMRRFTNNISATIYGGDERRMKVEGKRVFHIRTRNSLPIWP